VCADFYGRMREIAAEWFERDISELPLETSYGLTEWGITGNTQEERDLQYESLHRFAVTERNLFKSEKMIPGARKYLRMLSDEGYRIRIITHRLYISYFHAEAVQQTIEWLDYNGIPYWDLCFMKEKDAVGADIYREDSPVNIKRLRDSRFHTICFGNSTNKDVVAPRVETWEEAYKAIRSYNRG